MDHLGPASARVFPGSSLPCPYLFRGSVVRVSGSSVSSTDDAFVGDEVRVNEVRPSKRFREAGSYVEEEEPLLLTPTAATGTLLHSSSSEVCGSDGTFSVTPSEKRKLCAAFRTEAKRACSRFKDQLVQELHHEFPSIGDRKNSNNELVPGHSDLSDRYREDEYAFD